MQKAAEIVRELGYSIMLDPVTRRELRSNVDSLSQARQKFVASALAHDDLVAQEADTANAMRVSLLSGPVFGSDGKVSALLLGIALALVALFVEAIRLFRGWSA